MRFKPTITEDRRPRNLQQEAAWKKWDCNSPAPPLSLAPRIRPCLQINPPKPRVGQNILSLIIQNLALSHATLTGTESEHLSRCQSEISSYFDEISLEVMNIIALPPSQKDNIATALTLTVPCPLSCGCSVALLGYLQGRDRHRDRRDVGRNAAGRCRTHLMGDVTFLSWTNKKP